VLAELPKVVAGEVPIRGWLAVAAQALAAEEAFERIDPVKSPDFFAHSKAGGIPTGIPPILCGASRDDDF
jgi:hypothetical protein